MKKVKIKYLGETFLLNENVIRTTDWNGYPIKPTVTISRVEGATIIKQYIKKKYPKIGVSSTSEAFSMGNSIDVYLFNKDGSKVSDEIYKDVNRFAQTLRMGKFNGMIDMYEHNEWTRHTDDGIVFDSYCKFITVSNNPRFGTVEWALSELLKGETKEDTLRWIDSNKREKFEKILG